MFPEKVAQWFSLRGIKEDSLKKFGIYWNGSEIVIPIRDDHGEVLYKKFRRDPEATTGPKYRNESGSTNTLFNFNTDADTIIMTEGELDTVLLSSMGYDACSLTGGSQSVPEHLLPKFTNKKVYICYDKDKAGYEGAVKLAWKLKEVTPMVYIVCFPLYMQGKDITDYMQYHSKEEFNTLLKQAYAPCFPNGDDVQVCIDACVSDRRVLNNADLSKDALEFHLTKLNSMKDAEKRKKKKRIVDDTIEELKRVPITDYIEFNPAGFAHCKWHNEKTPSMKYYEDTNTVYCFGCGESADVIKVVRHLNNCSFLEALKILKGEDI